MPEIWKKIPGFEPYEASDFGRIRGGRGIRKPYKTRRGYMTIMLNLGGKKVQRGVHQLVMMAFEGPPPPLQEVCHRDNDKENNMLSNLRYDTKSANRKDSLAADDCHLAVLTVSDVMSIRYSTERTSSLSEKYGVSQKTIRLVKRRITWNI